MKARQLCLASLCLAGHMLKIKDPAPRFDCTAIVECELMHLKWHQLHGNHNLLLLFDSVDEYGDRPNDLSTLRNAAHRFAKLQCTVAVVCRDEEFEILAWMNRSSAALGSKPLGFPIIVDATNRIASMYDMLTEDGPLWGHVIADSNAKVRSLSAHSVPVGPNVDELTKLVASIVESDAD